MKLSASADVNRDANQSPPGHGLRVWLSAMPMNHTRIMIRTGARSQESMVEKRGLSRGISCAI